MGMLKKRSQFYRTLATLEEAGVPRIRALQQRHPQPFRHVSLVMAHDISEEGMTFAEAMKQHRRVFSSFEISVTTVGERTGRLNAVFTELADWYQLLQRLKSQIVGGLIYPFLLYHVAAILLPGISYFTGGTSLDQALLRMGLMVLIPDGALILYLLMKATFLPSEFRLPHFLAALIYHVPLLGSVVHRLNYTRFFKALALLLHSGAGMPEACRLAGASCSNSYISRRFLRLADQLQQTGCTFTKAFRETSLTRDRNSIVLSMMETGEEGGAVDEMAQRIANIYSEELEQSLKRLAVVIPVLIYGILAVYIALQIISFYHGIVDQYRSFM